MYKLSKSDILTYWWVMIFIVFHFNNYYQQMVLYLLVFMTDLFSAYYNDYMIF